MEETTESVGTNGDVHTSTIDIDQDLHDEDVVREAFLPAYSQHDHQPNNQSLHPPYIHQDDDQISSTNTTPTCGAMSVRFEEMLLEVINATTIHVHWCSCRKKALHGYKIRYTVKDTSTYNEIFVTSGITSYTLSGLRPNTEYVFCANAVDEKENVIENCGWGSQRTDELDEMNQQTPPYFAVIVGIILLITAVVVPLCILITAYCSHKHDFDAPYLTAVVAISLLLIAVLVPITFLFLRNCGQCNFASDKIEKPGIVIDKNGSQDQTTAALFSMAQDNYFTLENRLRDNRHTQTILWRAIVAQTNKTERNA